MCEHPYVLTRPAPLFPIMFTLNLCDRAHSCSLSLTLCDRAQRALSNWNMVRHQGKEAVGAFAHEVGGCPCQG